jgi:hypothetical protein
MSASLSSKIPKNKKVIDWFKVDEKVAYATTSTEFIVIDNDVVSFFNFSNVNNVVKQNNTVSFSYNNNNYNFKANNVIVNRFPTNKPVVNIPAVIKPDIELQSSGVNYKLKSDSLESELKSLKTKFDMYKETFEEIKQKLTLKTDEFNILNTKFELYKESIGKEKADQSAKNNELNLFKTGLESVKVQFDLTKAKLDSMMAELNLAKNESSVYKEKYENLIAENRLIIESTNVQHSKQLESLKNELIDSKNQFNLISAELESSKEQFNSSKSEIEQLNKSNKDNLEYISLLEYKLKIMKTEITGDIEIKGISKDEAKEVVKKIINQVKTLLVN